MTVRILTAALAAMATLAAAAEDFNPIPGQWRWLDARKAQIGDEIVDVRNGSVTAAHSTAAAGFPIAPEDAFNLTWSPDSTLIAYTQHGDLYIYNIQNGDTRRLTTDASDVIMNGYASWVYFEEIFGRPSKYRAFWWSPDSRRIAFYRFDESNVETFPIHSPFGRTGTLRTTRYPKSGTSNPSVTIGIADLTDDGAITWADFNPADDQYFGTPFWNADGTTFIVPRMPRIQNTLELYAVTPSDGSKRLIYNESYPNSWLDWPEQILFTPTGIIMARNFETGWQQIYSLNYDGTSLRRLTDGSNWRIQLLSVTSKGEVYFTAERDSRCSSTLYRVDSKGRITAITDPALHAENVAISPDGKYFIARLSNHNTPSRVVVSPISAPSKPIRTYNSAATGYDPSHYSIPEMRTINVDGFELPAKVWLPDNFEPSRKYPVVIYLYGGPDNPMVYDKWETPSESNQWYARHDIIYAKADCRSSGHNGRAGLDQVYLNLGAREALDYVEWAKYFQSLPYVRPDKIGVTGFSFGGTMTTTLLLKYSDWFHYGIAGGGVYDWALYDSHYTERFMRTPQDNPDGYASSRVLDMTDNYPAVYDETTVNDIPSVMLRLTHGTGDENVHFQNTLQLIDRLHKGGKRFDFMIYPDGMHGYHGYQGRHYEDANHTFWLRHLQP